MKEMIERLNKLISKYPDLPVEMLVDGEMLCDTSEFQFTQHGIKSVEIVKWYDEPEYGIFTGIDNIVEHLMDTYEYSEVDATEKAMNESKDVILIKTGAV
jgi:hypothetical protein